MQWFGYNPNFGWNKFSDVEMSAISKEHINDARDTPGHHVAIDGGHRDVAKYLETWQYGEIEKSLPIIEYRFHSSGNEETGGCCVWLTACLLVNTVNIEKERTMRDYMDSHKSELR